MPAIEHVSVNERKAPYTGLVGSFDECVSCRSRRQVAVDCIEAGLDRHDIIFAVISRPAGEKHVGGVLKSSDHDVFLSAADEEANGRKLMRTVPIHYIWSLHRSYIGNLANAVPPESPAALWRRT